MSPKHLILGGLLLIAAALSLTSYNLWEDHQASVAARQALAAVSYTHLDVYKRQPSAPPASG